MFLSVSGSLSSVKLTDAQRTELARRIEAELYRQYRGNKKAAYMAADVNSATLQRAIEGLSIKERSLAAIVGTLWPESDGDWRNLDPPLDALVDETPLRRAILESRDLDDVTRAALLELLDSRQPPPQSPQRHQSA